MGLPAGPRKHFGPQPVASMGNYLTTALRQRGAPFWRSGYEDDPHGWPSYIWHIAVQEHEATVYGSMKSVTAYFGEDWDAIDPSRVLRVIRDFMNLFNKAQHEIEVWPSPQKLIGCPLLQDGCISPRTPALDSLQGLQSHCQLIPL